MKSLVWSGLDDSRAISPWPWPIGPRTLSPWHLKSLGPWGQGPEVRGTLGPRPLGPWDLMCQGLKVRGPKVRGPMGQGLMALESYRIPPETVTDHEFQTRLGKAMLPAWHAGMEQGA